MRRFSWMVPALIAFGCSKSSHPDAKQHHASAASAVAQQSNAPVAPPTPTPVGLVPLSGPQLLSKIRASSARGVVVNAWASWCGPCREEMPMLVALSQSLPQIEVLFVSVDEPESRPVAEAFLREQGVEVTAYAVEGRLGPFKQALNPNWPGMIPATFLFDRTARLRYFWGGPVYEEEIVPILEGYLAGKDIDGEAVYGLAPGKVVPAGEPTNLPPSP